MMPASKDEQMAKKILFLVSEDWFFCSHILDRAKAARDIGYDVVILTRVTNLGDKIRAEGLRLIPLYFDRGSLSLISNLRTLLQIVAVYRQERPQLIHQFALKPILLGSVAARLVGKHRLINAVIGMGYVFTSELLLVRMMRPILAWALKLLLNPPGSRVVFENNDDLLSFVAAGMIRQDAAVLIRGAGVAPAAYPVANTVVSPPTVMLVARMLRDKGVGEFVDAARLLFGRGVRARFVLVGGVDYENRSAINESTLEQWQKEGIVEWWGHRVDIPDVLAQAQIACLPSYREGLPKSLLEAMAAGLPCVTTDVPGCREAVRDGETGFLVPPKDPMALANALKILIQDPALRRQMGRRGRAQVLTEFSSTLICEQTLQLYKKLLAT
jgi:glycosyltransferase involved in cell wall biosynthesis